MNFRPSKISSNSIFITLFVTIACFLVSTAVVQYRLRTVETVALKIETIAAPSLDYLTMMLASVKDVRANTATYIEDLSRGNRSKNPEDKLIELRQRCDNYLEYDLLPGEDAFWHTLRKECNSIQSSVKAMLNNATLDNRNLANRDFQESVLPIAVKLNETIQATILHDVNVVRSFASEVRDIRTQSFEMILFLNILVAGLALLTGAIVFIIMRRHQALMITYNQLANDRLQELDQFAGRVAHDIKGPLATMAMGVDLFQNSSSKSDIALAIKSVNRGLAHARQLIDDLLVFARAGGTPAADSRANVAKVMQEINSQCKPAASERGIELSIEDCPVNLEVACTEGVLASLVENLVFNAIKYMGSSEERRVRVRIQANEETATLIVEDTGPGISSELQPKLFMPFARGEKTGEDGCGLGLATVKRLVEAHRGKISFRSTQGLGALFTVEIPRVLKGPIYA